MSTITPDHLRDLAHIQHARSCGETPLQDTPAWQAAERIEALEAKVATAEARLGRITGAVQQARLYAGDNLPAGPGCSVVHMLEQALKEAAAHGRHRQGEPC